MATGSRRVQKEFYNILKTNPNRSFRSKDLGESVGVSPAVVHWNLKELIHKGLVCKVRRGFYKSIKDIDFEREFPPPIQSIQYPVKILPVRKFLTQLAKGLKYRTSNRKKFVFCNILLEHLIDLWHKQDGRCILSGVPMTTIRGTESGWQVPTNASVDRIDNNLGYISGNIQLVCWQVNLMKGQLTNEELVIFCKLIFNHRNGGEKKDKK